MRKLILPAALGLIAPSGAALAGGTGGSVLERVIGSIDNAANVARVNGTFANIAENIGIVTIPGTMIEGGWSDGTGSVTDAQMQAAWQAAQDAYVADFDAAHWIDVHTFEDEFEGTITQYWYHDQGNQYYSGYDSMAEAEAAQAADAAAALAADTALSSFETWQAATYTYTEGSVTDPVTILTAIDGSIANTLSGLRDANDVAAGQVAALDRVRVDLGDMSTTVLGAVNTGAVTLGVNQDVSEAIAGSTSAVSGAVAELGGTADTGTLVLNVALNATGVTGAVGTVMSGLDGGMGNVSTTVLGAVNTGTITSGVDAAVTGIRSGIVGIN